LQKKAFTLIELLIVIVIMGVIYTLAINNFDKLNDKTKTLSLSNLKEYLKSFPYQTKIELICTHRCLKCSVFVDNNKTKDIDKFLDSDIQKYKYDFDNGYIKIENDTFFNKKNVEQDVCFSYSLNKNRVGEQVLVEYKNRFYDFSDDLKGIKIYNSLEEATKAKEKLIEEVKP